MAESPVGEWPQAIGLSALVRPHTGLLQGGGSEGIRWKSTAPFHRGRIWYGLHKNVEHFSSLSKLLRPRI